MMASMPKKKGPKDIHFRLKPDEAAALEADRQALPGVPVTASAYAKHATFRFAKLRKLEELVRRDADKHIDEERYTPGALLKEAGL